MINSLQMGRFLAAMAVVVHHGVISTTAFVDPVPAVMQFILNYGFLGVDFFFVLSGFIIHFTMYTRPRPALRFAVDRSTRIMLPYLPVAIVLAVAYTIFPNLSEGERSWGWISTLTLIPTESPPALSVAWTLQHELIFYFIYAALFFSGRIWIGLGIWGAAITSNALIAPSEWTILNMVLAPINLEFISGVIAAAMFLSSRAVPTLGSLALAACFLFVFALVGADRSESWLVGFAIAALVPWLCRLEGAGAFQVPRWFVFGGAASYAIYLVHNPLLSILSRLMSQYDISWVLSLLVSTLASFVAGAVWYLMWEKPIMKLVKRAR